MLSKQELKNIRRRLNEHNQLIRFICLDAILTVCGNDKYEDLADIVYEIWLDDEEELSIYHWASAVYEYMLEHDLTVAQMKELPINGLMVELYLTR